MRVVRFHRLRALVWLALLQSCGAGGAALQGGATVWDEDVPAELRARLDVLDGRVADAIRAGDAAAILQLVPEPYRAKWGTQEALSSSFSTLKEAEIGTPSPLWHVVLGRFSAKTGMNTMLPPRVLGEPKAFFAYANAVEERVAVTFRRAALRGGEILLAATWVPEEEGWGLYALQTGAFSLGGKDALDWYDEVTRLEKERKPTAAALRSSLVGELLRPVPTMQYQRQGDVVAGLARIQKEVNARHTWPIGVGQGLPVSVYRLDLMVVAEDRSLNVIIAYVSPGTALTEAAVAPQAASLHPQVLAMFPDLCEGAKRVVYRLFEAPPVDRTKTYRSYSVPVDCPAP